MKRAVLLGPLATAGDESWRRVIEAVDPREDRDFLVGVDGGAAHWLVLGYRPHLAVGDWDSIGDVKVLRDVRMVNLPREKDESDTWHAILAAAKAGARRIVGVGLTGGRPDHHLAVLLDFARAASGRSELPVPGGLLAEVRLEGTDGSYFFLSEKIPAWNARLEAGSTVSVFALGAPARGVTLRGLKYSLDHSVLSPGSRGLSNEALGGGCEVRLEQGQLLVVVPSRIERP